MDVGHLDVGMSYDNEDLGLPKSLPQLKGGWYVLVYPIAIKTEIKGSNGFSIALPEEVALNHRELITAGIVVKMGPLAYRHPKYKDPDTEEYLPWCQPGDFAVFSRASFSQSITHEGKKFYLMPDESLLYTVEDIRQINPFYDYDENELKKLKEEIKRIND